MHPVGALNLQTDIIVFKVLNFRILATNNPILSHGGIGHTVFWGLFWFSVITLVEQSIQNISIIIQQSWQASYYL